MSLTLTPEQQAKLEAFDTASDSATDAKSEADASAHDLLVAEERADHAYKNALDTQAAALESAQAFVDSMMNPTAPASKPTPVDPQAAKK